MKKKITIEGMSCKNCVKHVEEALGELENVNKVEVILEEKCAIVEATATDQEMIDAIDDAGYDVVSIQSV